MAPDDLQQLCRICLNYEDNLRNIESTTIVCNDHSTPLLQILNLVSVIEISGDYSNKICKYCLKQAVIIYKFTLQCKEANEYFEQSVKTKTKETQTDWVCLDVATNTNTSEIDEGNENTTIIKQENTKLPISENNDISEGSILKDVLTRTPIECNENTFECNKCAQIYGTEEGSLACCNNKKKNYLCSYCGKSYTTLTHLRTHTRLHTKDRVCKICDRPFAAVASLQRHMLTHTGERPFKCDICDMGFKSKTDVRRHCISHTNIKPHVCSICHKRFRTKQTLLYHNQRHRNDRPYWCTICNSGFVRRGDLNSHNKRKHSNNNDDDDDDNDEDADNSNK